ncbi:MAG: Crp/Fnr family transcriptional regulator [Peptococcaceae bacterium]|nr:Crp/Fnr family transcriptional regulator [Peptococcaceae bacterium]
MWDQKWLAQFPQVAFPAKAHIISVGEPVRYNYYLMSGVCAKILPLYNGEDYIAHYYYAGKMLGVHLHRYGQASQLDFQARTACVCYKIPQQEVAQQIAANSRLCYGLLQELADELDDRGDLSAAQFAGGGISILSMALKSLAVMQKDGQYHIPAFFTNVELSNYCGIHAVTISRLLSKLKSRGILERTKDGIVVYDMEKLSACIRSEEA